jgi:V8-like Glu-specific endopeptidase
VSSASARTGRPGSSSLGAHAAWSGLELTWQNYAYGTANPVAAVGRIFFTENGQLMVCSGTLVAPNIVLTAAHCIRDGKTGAWNSNWEFIPDVNGTSQPYGAFAARTVTLPTNWSSPSYNSVPGTGGQGYWPLDYGFLVLSPNSAGYNAGQYTGWYGMLANAPRTGSIFDLGYPAEGPWRASCTSSSCSPQFCNSPIQVHDVYQGGMSDVGISCYSSGGASGGPWFQTYNGQTYVASVMSDMGVVHTYAPNGERYGLTFFGAYFDNTALSMFSYANTL